MARIRQIKPDFYLDDDLALCSREARLMFPGLWMLADRAGRLEDRPARIKAQVFPYDDDIGSGEVGKFLEQLAAHGFIIRYQAGGKNLIQIRTFEKHQHCHIKEPNSQLPPPEEVTEKPGASTVPAPVLHRSSPAAFTSTSTSTSTSGVRLLDNGNGGGSGKGVRGKGGEPESLRLPGKPLAQDLAFRPP